MATVFLLGFGFHLQVGDTSSPPQFSNILQLRKLSTSGSKTEFEDVTNMDSIGAYHEIAPVLLDPGGVDFEGVWNPADSTQAGLLTTFDARAKQTYRIQAPSASGRIEFDAYVETAMDLTIEYNKAVSFTGKLKITGPRVFTPSV